MPELIWEEIFAFIESSKAPKCITPPLSPFDKYNVTSYANYKEHDSFDLFVLHKDLYNWFDVKFIDHLFNDNEVLLANEVFIIFGKGNYKNDKIIDPIHIDSLLNKTNLQRNEEKSDKLILFIHIQKSGGTSLLRLLTDKYKNNIHFVGGNNTLEKYNNDLLKYNLVTGHINRGLLERKLSGNNNIIWLTILRNPVERFFSYVAHARREQLENISPPMLAIRNMELKEFIKSPIAYQTLHTPLYLLTNEQYTKFNTCKLDSIAEEVLYFLESDNVYFGFQDKLDEYIKIISNAIKLDDQPIADINLKENVTLNYESISDDEKNDIYEILMEELQADMDFYNKAIDLYKQKYSALIQ